MNPKSAKTLANRAAAYLELDMFIEALNDARESSEIEPSEKAFFRMGRALYEMRQYSDAAECFNKCLDINSKNNNAAKEVKRCEARIHESRTGEYDIKALVEQADAGVKRLDVGDYVSPDIEIQDIPNMGKGYVALKDIKRGTLLVASKAACASYDDGTRSIHICYINIYSQRYGGAACLEKLGHVYFKIQHDPFFAKKVTNFLIFI